MDPFVLTVGAAAALLVVVVLFLHVSPDLVRGVALTLSLLALAVAGNNSVPTNIYVAVFSFVIVLLLVSVGRRGRESPRASPMFVLIAAWWGLIALGILWAGSYSISRMAIYFGVVLTVSYVTSRLTRRELRVVLLGFLAIVAFEAVWGLAEILANIDPLWGLRGGVVRTNPFLNDDFDRVQGTMGQPIVYGLLGGVGFLIAWSNAIVALKSRWRSTALAVSGLVIVLSGTRSVALALVVAIGVHLIIRWDLALWLRNVVLAAIAGVFVFSLDFGIRGLIDGLLASGSWTHRVGSIVAIPVLLEREGSENLWGSGFGSEVSLFDDGYIEVTFGLKVVDNMFVYLLGTTGIIGLVVCLFVAGVAFARASKLGKALITLNLVMFFSFDVLVWTFSGILLAFVLSLPGATDAAFADVEEAVPARVRGKHVWTPVLRETKIRA